MKTSALYSSVSSDQILERFAGLYPKAIDLILDRIHILLEKLDNPHRRLPPIIHIAGTNGKGSTLAFLKASLAAAGQGVHSYTSPHLVRFHERISLSGRTIEETQLKDVLLRCENANAGELVTYFEITTVAAFLAFSESSADFCLLETGLGGRLDATNVVEKPELTLITPVSHDHEEFLGADLAQIAYEKAGIMKTDIPCFSAQQLPEVEAVLKQRAKEINTRLVFIKPLDFDFPLSLLGNHQKQNAALAQAACRFLGLAQKEINQGLQTAEWPGRLQQLKQTSWNQLLPDQMEIWLDGGHNASAGQALADFIKDSWQDQPLHIVFGILKNKDAGNFIRPLLELTDTITSIRIPCQENSLSGEEALTLLRSLDACEGATLQQADGLADSLKMIAGMETERNGKPARVLICGSLYLAGWVLAHVHSIAPSLHRQKGGV